MAFIRQYMAASGDPFRFRVPRFIRPPKKLRAALGKVGGLVGRAATFLPGPLGTAASLIQGDPYEGFARGYGYMAGDPGSRRKSAGAGPKHKAAQKAKHRAGPKGPTGPMKRRAKGGSGGHGFHLNLGKLAGSAARIGGAVVNALPGGGIISQVGHELGINAPSDDAPAVVPITLPDGTQTHAVVHGGKRRRRHNPANVHALRKALTRVGSFERLVKSVRKSARKLNTIVNPHRGPARVHAFGKRK